MTRRTLLDRLLGSRRRASAATRVDLAAVTPNQAVWTGKDPAKLLTEGYEAAVWAYAAVQQIQKQLAQTRWLMYQGDQELETHPLLELLRRPNDEQSGSAFIEAVGGYYATVGNAYIEALAAGENAAPIELWVKRPDRMKVIPGTTERVKGYEYRVGSQRHTYEPWEIRHIKTWAPLDDYYGLGAIQAAARGIDLFNVGQAQNLALMQNGARPTGAWVTEGQLDDKPYQRLREQMREHLTGTRGRGAPLLLEGGVKWQELGITPRELDWVKGQVDAARQIHAAFGVHPVLTGLEAGTYENQEQAKRGLLINVVLPILDRITEELNAWLVPRYGRQDLRLGYDRDAWPALSEDEMKLWDRSIRGYDRGILTRNEARLMLGYGEVEGGDEFKSSGAPGFGLLSTGPQHARAAKGPGRIRAADPAAYRLERIRLQLEWEARLTEWVSERLNDQRRRITDGLKAAATYEEAAAVIEIEASRTEDWDGLAAWWLAIAYAGGIHAAQAHGLPQAQKAARPPHARADAPEAELLTELMKELWGLYFTDAVTKAEEHVPLVVGEISQTTKRQLMELISEAVSEGLSIPDAAERIDTLQLEEIIPNRSTVIARTEVISSSNYGGQQAARATGLRLRKRWLSTADERTRPEHVEANGQVRDLDENYLVGGESLAYPGDPNGSPANVIQCRCTETYEEAEET